MKLVLDVTDAAAMNDLLRNVGPQGRSEIRKHARIFSAFNAVCRKFKPNSETEFTLEAGEFDIPEEIVPYFKSVLEERMLHGVPGLFCESYVKFMDLVDNYLGHDPVGER